MLVTSRARMKSRLKASVAYGDLVIAAYSFWGHVSW
jgi:hypothetical protein